MASKIEKKILSIVENSRGRGKRSCDNSLENYENFPFEDKTSLNLTINVHLFSIQHIAELFQDDEL